MLITCCKSKELERNKEETKREFRGNSDDLYFMLIKPIYRQSFGQKKTENQKRYIIDYKYRKGISLSFSNSFMPYYPSNEAVF